MGYDAPATLRVTGGALSAGSIKLDNQSELLQTAGDVSAGDLIALSGTRHLYSGGTLNIAGGGAWVMEGELDCDNSAVTVDVGSVGTASAVNLAGATLADAGSATVNVLGTNSFLVITPASSKVSLSTVAPLSNLSRSDKEIMV